MKKKVPSYRHRKGFEQAIVTLTDAKTKKRRDYWLGPHGSPESYERYYRILAEWEAGERVLPTADMERTPSADGIKIFEVIHAYWSYARDHYEPSEAGCIKVVGRLLRQFYGQTPAVEFGPKKLRFLREQMISGDDNIDPPRPSWSRGYINQQIKRIRRMFKWAASHEMLPVAVAQQLGTIEPLKRGRSNARETEPVRPVPIEWVHAVEPYVSKQVWAIIQLQLLTGARGGELFKLRPLDINRDDESGIWTHVPIEHKTAYMQRSRLIMFGPKAQDVIHPFLLRSPEAFCFSPAEADIQRREALSETRVTPLSWGNGPGTNRRKTPKKKPGEHYTSASYYRAIQYACDKAFPPPERLRPKMLPNGKRETKRAFNARLKKEEAAELKAWRKAHRWHPHQLRHTAGTEIRRDFGLEAAQIILGHSSAQITDAVYAERDVRKAIDVMQRIG